MDLLYMILFIIYFVMVVFVLPFTLFLYESDPDRSFLAQRVRSADGTRGDWRHVTFAQALDAARRIAQALLDRGLSAARPVVILSENDIEHALLTLGCLLAGVPWCPASPAYSTISQDYGKLRHILGVVTPGLVFASDARFAKAIGTVVPVAVPQLTLLAMADALDKPAAAFIEPATALTLDSRALPCRSA